MGKTTGRMDSISRESAQAEMSFPAFEVAEPTIPGRRTGDRVKSLNMGGID